MSDYLRKINNNASKLLRKESVRNFSAVFVANLISMIISLGVALFVPKVLPIADYAYWQLYVFYVTYVGVMHLGIADGIYLRYGGKDYKKLDKKLLRSQFMIVCVFQFIMLGFIVSLALSLHISDGNKKLIAILVGFNFILVNARTFLQMLLQATNRMTEYSKNIIFERGVYVLLVALSLLLGYWNFYYLIYADIAAKVVMLLLLCYVCRDVVFGPIQIKHKEMLELWRNISAGAKLMFANLAGILTVGVVRIIIEYRWGLSIFGQVALALTVSSLVLVFITAAGVVVYPILKRTKSDLLPLVYVDLRNVLVPVMFIFLLTYFPMHFLLNVWLPHYSYALAYLFLVFPLAFYEAKTQIITNTYLKAYRKEGALLIINLASVGLSIILALVCAFILESIELTLMSIVVSLAFKSALSEYLLGKTLKINLLAANISEFGAIVLFITIVNFLPQYAFLVCFFIVFAYVFAKKNSIINALKRSFLS